LLTGSLVVTPCLVGDAVEQVPAAPFRGKGLSEIDGGQRHREDALLRCEFAGVPLVVQPPDDLLAECGGFELMLAARLIGDVPRDLCDLLPGHCLPGYACAVRLHSGQDLRSCRLVIT